MCVCCTCMWWMDMCVVCTWCMTNPTCLVEARVAGDFLTCSLPFLRKQSPTESVLTVSSKLSGKQAPGTHLSPRQQLNLQVYCHTWFLFCFVCYCCCCCFMCVLEFSYHTDFTHWTISTTPSLDPSGNLTSIKTQCQLHPQWFILTQNPKSHIFKGVSLSEKLLSFLSGSLSTS